MNPLPEAIPESVAMSLALRPQPTEWYGSRAYQTECKERKLLPLGVMYVSRSEPPQPKATRVRAGRLANLMDMPVDIFLEIVMKMHPLDLLRLSRASKHFRSILLTKNSRHLWVSAFKNVPGVPACSPYISEPRYAAALFDQYCFACGIARSTNVNYTVSVRLCAPCFKTNFKQYDEMHINLDSLLPSAKKLLPSLCVSTMKFYSEEYKSSADAKKNSTFSCRTNKFYYPEFKMIVKKFASLRTFADRRTFVEERQQFVTLMQTHDLSVLRWLRGNRNERYTEEDAAREDRKIALLERLEELGYTPADFPDNDAWNKIMARPTRLTDRIWKATQPKLVALIEQKREDDRQAAFDKRRRKRCAEFAPFYEVFLQSTLSQGDLLFAPNLRDACTLPSILEMTSEDDANIEVTQERTTVIEERMVLDVREYAAQTKRDLIEMLHREKCGRGNYTTPPSLEMPEVDVELTKASSLFVCRRCSLKVPVSATAICAHWRAEHPRLKWNDKWPIEESFDHRRRYSDRPSTLPWVKAMSSGPARTMMALSALGLPADTSMAQLDDWVREGRLVCLCAHPTLMSLTEPSWGTLIHHVSGQIDWHNSMSYKRPRYYVQGGIIDDHYLSGKTTCLKLLAEGELLAIPQYSIPDDVAADVTLRLDENETKPSCSTCYELVKENARWSGMYLEKNLQVLAHHMKTKHDKSLSKGSICFQHYRY
ncbi:hypothetical protein VTO73DRAFT_3527 [Trametes versicolor]